MSPVLQLLLQLSILIAAAKLAGLLSTKLGQPAVLGEILAGLLLGPSFINLQALPVFTSPHLPRDHHRAGRDRRHPADVPGRAGGGPRADAPVGPGGGPRRAPGRRRAVAHGRGRRRSRSATPTVQALGIGLLLTATSVSISAQTLLELGVLRSREGIALLGAAVVDDVVVILLVSIFLALAGGAARRQPKTSVCCCCGSCSSSRFSAVLGWLLVPRLLDRRRTACPSARGSLATAVVLALFFAWSAEVIGGVAMITGSFLAGVFAGAVAHAPPHPRRRQRPDVRVLRAHLLRQYRPARQHLRALAAA